MASVKITDNFLKMVERHAEVWQVCDGKEGEGFEAFDRSINSRHGACQLIQD
jgi:hypothetical protein